MRLLAWLRWLVVLVRYGRKLRAVATALGVSVEVLARQDVLRVG